MDLRQLEYFVAVAEEGSFTLGALRVHSVQSAASASVARLERQLGQALFVRAGRRLELTDAGRVLLVRARSICDEVDRTRTELDALRDGLAGSVTIGTILTFGSTVLPAALEVFHRRFPNVAIQLQLSAAPVDTHLERVRDGTFHLSVVPMPPQIPADVAMNQLIDVRLGLACPAGHPLARAREVRYEQLVGETFIDFPTSWGNRLIVDGLFASRGCGRSVAVEVTSVGAALELVAGGLGVSFIPEQFVAHHPDVAVVDLLEPPPLVTLGVAIARHGPMVAAALFRILLETAVALRTGHARAGLDVRAPAVLSG